MGVVEGPRSYIHAGILSTINSSQLSVSKKGFCLPFPIQPSATFKAPATPAEITNSAQIRDQTTAFPVCKSQLQYSLDKLVEPSESPWHKCSLLLPFSKVNYDQKPTRSLLSENKLSTLHRISKLANHILNILLRYSGQCLLNHWSPTKPSSRQNNLQRGRNP